MGRILVELGSELTGECTAHWATHPLPFEQRCGIQISRISQGREKGILFIPTSEIYTLQDPEWSLEHGITVELKP